MKALWLCLAVTSILPLDTLPAWSQDEFSTHIDLYSLATHGQRKETVCLRYKIRCTPFNQAR